MRITAIHQSPSISILNFRCTATPGDKPYPEIHRSHALAYVRRGSFGYRTQGKQHELVAGAVLVSKPSREYMATHDHHDCGDECLSVNLSPELAESLGSGNKFWDTPRLPPLPQLVVLGELWQAAADGRNDAGADELSLLFTSKCVETLKGDKPEEVKATERDRRRAVEAALWIEENSSEDLSLETAAKEAGLSPFHFLRVFNKVLGVTPHQYLVRTRLRRAARLLAEGNSPVTEVALDAGFADLSNFVRSFRRAAGASPREFRRAARGERKILQERIPTAT
jgi:AraC-like DNA-binding protein